MNNVNSTEDILKYQLFTELLKSTAGVGEDSQSFSAAMESVISALNGINGSGETAPALDEINKSLTSLGSDKNTSLESSTVEDAINEAADKYNVDAKLIKSIIKQESNFDPDSVSSAGAMGLMQLMPSNAKYYGVSDPFDVNQNVDAGTKLLKDYLNMYGNNKKMALAAYNAGPSRMKNEGVKDTSEFYKLPKETQNYVKKIMSYYSDIGEK